MKRKSESGIKLQIYIPDRSGNMKLPLYDHAVSAGFPSPADDYLDKKLDLNEYVIKNPSATFFVKVTGNSMINAGINDGDILVVDRSLEARDNRIVVGVIDGEFTVKRIRKKNNRMFLLPENDSFKPIEITPEMDFRIWGVITYALRKL